MHVHALVLPAAHLQALARLDNKDVVAAIPFLDAKAHKKSKVGGVFNVGVGKDIYDQRVCLVACSIAVEIGASGEMEDQGEA